MYRKILIIAPSLDSCKKLKYELTDKTTGAYYVMSVKDGIRHLTHYECLLIIMDISFPNATWLQSLQELREITPAPILVLSASGESRDIVKALSIADDYLQKPFDMEVCRARVQALLRRPAFGNESLPCVLSEDGNLLVIPQHRIVRVMDVEIILPRKQFDLLYLLMSQPKRVFTREQLYESVWGEDFTGGENTLNCQMCSLRRKLETVPNAPKYIQTFCGVGYRFDTHTA